MTAPGARSGVEVSALPQTRRGKNVKTPRSLAARVVPLVQTLRDYRITSLRPDLVAGLTVALFTIPQSLAYALIAGFPPSAGLATAVAASILGAAFGSSEFVINGPTNAISVMVAANVSLFAAQGNPVEAIVLLTLLVGAIQVAAALLKAGSLARFVGEPVLTGFTAGAGVYIIVNQLPSFLGLEKSALAGPLLGLELPKAAFFDLLRLGNALPRFKLASLGIGCFTFLLIRLGQFLEKRLNRRLPATFIAVVAATGIVALLGLDHGAGEYRVKVVRDIEPLTRALPQLHLPHLDFGTVRNLLGAALSIAAMGSVEAIAISKMLAQRAGHPFDANQQLLGEGMCNLGAACVGGFASSGSFSRTAVNFEAGAVTRISCITSGALALLIVLAFAPTANLIPVAALAGTLVHVGLRLIDVGRLRTVFGATPGDRAVTLATFFGVLLLEHLEFALALGIWLSLYFALRRAEGFKLRPMAFGSDGALREVPPDDAATHDATPNVVVLNLQGELFFAAADEIQAELLLIVREVPGRHLVLRMQEAYNMDVTAATALGQVAAEAKRHGGRLLLCGVRTGMLGTLERAHVINDLGRDAIFEAEGEILASTRRAYHYAKQLAG